MRAKLPRKGDSNDAWLTRFGLPAFVVLLGVALRFLAMRRGHNFDFDSYRIVVDIMARGGNVYAETERYNYGPVWFTLLHTLDLIAGALHRPEAFRYLLVSLLTFADLGIFAILYRRFTPAAAYLFLLNPISIIITGYHNQFDNLAILIGLWGTLAYGDPESRDPLPKLAGLLLIALSLTTKHFLFVFPLWIAIRERGMFWKIVSLILPPTLFLLGFFPFWARGQDGILANVFLYRSFDNAPFYNVFVPDFAQHLIAPFTLMLLGLIVAAFAFRKRPLTESLIIYALVLVMCSPAVTNQYLAIAVPAASLYFNPFTIAYSGLGAALLASDVSGLHMTAAKRLVPDWLQQERVRLAIYNPLIASLFFMFLLAFLRVPLRRMLMGFLRWVREELQVQGASMGTFLGHARPLPEGEGWVRVSAGGDSPATGGSSPRSPGGTEAVLGKLSASKSQLSPDSPPPPSRGRGGGGSD